MLLAFVVQFSDCVWARVHEVGSPVLESELFLAWSAESEMRDARRADAGRHVGRERHPQARGARLPADRLSTPSGVRLHGQDDPMCVAARVAQ